LLRKNISFYYVNSFDVYVLLVDFIQVQILSVAFFISEINEVFAEKEFQNN